MRDPLDKSNGGSGDEIEHVRAVTPDELPPRVIITKRMQKVRGVNTAVRYNQAFHGKVKKKQRIIFSKAHFQSKLFL